MAYKVSYIYEIIDNYSGPLSRINDKTSAFKKIISDFNKGGGLKTYNRNLSKTATLYSQMNKPLTKFNQKMGQNTRSARGFNEQLTISRGNMKALRREAAAFKATMPRAPNIVRGGMGSMGMGGMGMGGFNMGAITAAIITAIGPVKAYQAGSSFEYKMVSAMAKIGDVTEAQKSALQVAAFTEAKRSKFTTSDVASAIDTMAMAGFNVKEIVDSLGGVLQLSQATETDIVTSTSIAAGALRAFGLEAKQMPLVADMFAKTAMSADTNVQQLGNAMKYVGPIAAKMGYDLETMLAVIATISNEQIKGEMAGTSTRAIMTRISADKNAGLALKAIGVNPREVTGEMKAFPALLKEISEGMKKVPRQNQEMFLTQIAGLEAISAFSIMLKEADQIARKELETRAALGTTQKIKTLKEDTVLGQQERLGSATNVLLTNLGLLGNSAFKTQEKLSALADWVGRQSEYFVVPEGAAEGTKSAAENALDKFIVGMNYMPANAVFSELSKLFSPVDSFNEDMSKLGQPLVDSSIWGIGNQQGPEASKVDVNVNVNAEGKATATVDSSGPSVGSLGVNMGGE